MKQVLLVETDSEQRAVLERALSEGGIEINVAEDAAAALRILGAEPVQLLVSGLEPTDKECLQLLLAARMDYPLLRIIVILSHAPPSGSGLALARRLGADAAFTLPLPLPILLETVREYVAGAGN